MSFKLLKRARLNSKNSSGYLKYAIGEIILVALGILIALQVNNMNQSRLEKKALKNYFEKIKSNVQLDIIESEKLLRFRTDHAHACNEVSQMLIENDFSNQLKIQQSIFDMIIEKTTKL
jgi:sensor domain CHASE-containing protein